MFFIVVYIPFNIPESNQDILINIVIGNNTTNQNRYSFNWRVMNFLKIVELSLDAELFNLVNNKNDEITKNNVDISSLSDKQIEMLKIMAQLSVTKDTKL